MSINGMLEVLRKSRESMARQISVLDEIKDKSNNILLLIESERSKEHPVQEHSGLKPYSCDKETEQLFARALELYQNVPQDELANEEIAQNDLGFADHLDQNCQNLNNLSSNVRKLLVVGEILNKAIEQGEKSEADNCEK